MQKLCKAGQKLWKSYGKEQNRRCGRRDAKIASATTTYFLIYLLFEIYIFFSRRGTSGNERQREGTKRNERERGETKSNEGQRGERKNGRGNGGNEVEKEETKGTRVTLLI